MSTRVLAIGDVHGCGTVLETLIQRICLTPLDTVILLGDLTDRGPDLRGILDWVIRLSTGINVISRMTWDSYDFTRLPLHVACQMEWQLDLSFLDRRENVLIFGQPGSGKSDVLAAFSEQWTQQGRSRIGRKRYRQSKRLLITSDCGKLCSSFRMKPD